MLIPGRCPPWGAPRLLPAAWELLQHPAFAQGESRDFLEMATGRKGLEVRGRARHPSALTIPSSQQRLSPLALCASDPHSPSITLCRENPSWSTGLIFCITFLPPWAPRPFSLSLTTASSTPGPVPHPPGAAGPHPLPQQRISCSWAGVQRVRL